MLNSIGISGALLGTRVLLGNAEVSMQGASGIARRKARIGDGNAFVGGSEGERKLGNRVGVVNIFPSPEKVLQVDRADGRGIPSSEPSISPETPAAIGDSTSKKINDLFILSDGLSFQSSHAHLLCQQEWSVSLRSINIIRQPDRAMSGPVFRRRDFTA